MGYDYNLGLAFYEVARTYNTRTGLRYPDGSVFTYAQLDERSNQTARYFISTGLSSGDVVAIFNDKSPAAYIAMLACLKTGITYTNLDNTNPWERLKKIITACEPRTVLYDSENEVVSAIAKEFPGINRTGYHHDTYDETIAGMDSQNLRETDLVHGGLPAYIMFTSGSTGFPKGAVMSHNNVLNFINWGQQTFDITEKDVFTNVNPIYFDNSVFDFYTSLFSGATLVPLDAAIVKNPRELVKAINKTGCTIWFSVPSLLVYLLTTKAISSSDFPTILRIAFGGEGFPKNKLKQLFDLFTNRVRLFNVYGPTECTCICSSYIITASDFENMNELAPLGYVAPNFGYEILPLEQGQVDFGELALTGPCVGLGYFNDPERTQKSFTQNPNKRYFERMYRTGDLVARDREGRLHFRGRVDNQIKHMGYRIELEEVEAAFSSFAYVHEVGVIYEKITEELGQIKAFISGSESMPATNEILLDLKKILPPYMMPKIMVVDSLPKNRNGKIDRRQLMQIK